MDHKYSSYTIFFFLFILFTGFVFSLDSSDVDELCAVNNSILFRYNDTWTCASLNDTVINYTINEIINVFNNWSDYAGHWDDHDTPGDITLDEIGLPIATVDINNQVLDNILQANGIISSFTHYVGDGSNLTNLNETDPLFDAKILANRSEDVTFEKNVIVDGNFEVGGLSSFYGTNSLHGASIYYAMARFRDGIPLYFGSSNDVEIIYNQTTQNLEIDTNRGAGGGILDIKHSVLIGENLTVNDYLDVQGTMGLRL